MVNSRGVGYCRSAKKSVKKTILDCVGAYRVRDFTIEIQTYNVKSIFWQPIFL